MKKIVIVTRSMQAGGAERVIAQLCNHFVKFYDCKVYLISINDDGVFYNLDDRIEYKVIGRKYSNKLVDRITCLWSLRKLVSGIHPNCVLTMPEDIGVYVILALIGLRTRLIVSERNNPWVMPDVKITRLLRRLMYPLVDGIVFQTQVAKSYFPSYISRKGIVLQNPMDLSRIPKLYEGKREKIIYSIGRLAPQKNFRLLIDAFYHSGLYKKEYSLVIYGEGIERKALESLIIKYGLGKNVFLPGRDENVLEKIRKGSMFVLSSDYEGMPNVLLEAMCMGMPVIATDCMSGGPRELIDTGKNGLLVEVGNVKQMSMAMLDMTNESFAEEMSRNACRIKNQYIDNRIFDDWFKYLLNE